MHAFARTLPLVLAIKGDMKGAERLARSDLPPQVANQNIAYFQALMSQPAYWSQYSPTKYDTPDFSPAPEKEAPKADDGAPLLRAPKPEKKQEPTARPMAKAKVEEVTRASMTPVETPAQPEAAKKDTIESVIEALETPAKTPDENVDGAPLPLTPKH